MSQQELNKILSNDFEKLWKELWMEDNNDNSHFKRDYTKALDKFTKIKS